MTSLKTSIKTITYLSDIGCLEIQGASLTTEKVYLSQIPGLVNMALYVSPIVSGEVIRSRGGSTSEFTPGYVKPKHLAWLSEAFV
ncbi:phage major capsid protein [Escherichia coli]|nr:phage major capsid protein [Escherichia coli]